MPSFRMLADNDAIAVIALQSTLYNYTDTVEEGIHCIAVSLTTKG